MGSKPLSSKPKTLNPRVRSLVSSGFMLREAQGPGLRIQGSGFVYQTKP